MLNIFVIIFVNTILISIIVSETAKKTIMLASYQFNTSQTAQEKSQASFPNLHLLEGGEFYPEQFSPVIIKEWMEVQGY